MEKPIISLGSSSYEKKTNKCLHKLVKCKMFFYAQKLQQNCIFSTTLLTIIAISGNLTQLFFLEAPQHLFFLLLTSLLSLPPSLKELLSGLSYVTGERAEERGRREREREGRGGGKSAAFCGLV